MIIVGASGEGGAHRGRGLMLLRYFYRSRKFSPNGNPDYSYQSFPSPF